MIRRPPRSTLFPTRRSSDLRKHHGVAKVAVARKLAVRLYWMERTEKCYPEVVRMQGSLSHPVAEVRPDRKSTRLNSSHSQISYAVFCLKKKKNTRLPNRGQV